jgi:hypothetical protein
MPVQMMLGQYERHDQRQQSLPVVLDEAQKLLLIFAVIRNDTAS